MTVSKQTLITSRDPEGRHAVGLFEAAYDKLGLNGVRAQRLNEHSGELQNGIANLIAELTTSDRYANEEVRSSYTYPEEYKGSEPIEEQIEAFAKIFGLNQSHALEFAKNLPKLPKGAEGWFAIPKWEKLAPTYGDAVKKMLAMIGSKRQLFYSRCEGQLGVEHLRQEARTEKMFQKLGEEQKDSDILVVPCQFGLRHRGRSVRRAYEVSATNEFSLDIFAVACMLLTHPKREVRWDQLHVFCAGDEFAPFADGDFSFAPIFHFLAGKVGLSHLERGNAHERSGSASGFVSQS